MPIKLLECKDWTVPDQPGKLLMYVKHREGGGTPEERGRFSAIVWVKDEDALARRKPAGVH